MPPPSSTIKNTMSMQSIVTMRVSLDQAMAMSVVVVVVVVVAGKEKKSLTMMVMMMQTMNPVRDAKSRWIGGGRLGDGLCKLVSISDGPPGQ